MASTSFLIFSILGSSFAIDPSAVKEIIWLPEISPIEEAPPYIVGAVNLRGKITPVMDLRMRLGRRSKRYSITDGIVVISVGTLSLGVIVDEVRDVREIPSEDIEFSPFYGMEGELRPYFVTRTAKMDREIVMILDHESLLHSCEPANPELPAGAFPMRREDYFLPDASPDERQIFHERAVRLLPAGSLQEQESSAAVAVVRLGEEYFGVDLEIVLEFCAVVHPTPVPCCPPHIVGNMNLRGNILTLVDIRGFLNLSPAPVEEHSKVVVASVNDYPAGIVIDELLDIIHVNPASIGPLPSSIHKEDRKYLKGTTVWNGRTVTMVDALGLLTSEEIVVNEEP